MPLLIEQHEREPGSECASISHACAGDRGVAAGTRRRAGFRARGALALLGLAAILAVAVTPACAGVGRPRLLVGFNEWPDSSNYGLQAEVGAPVRRMPVNWLQVESIDGSWNWERTDSQYAGLVAAGLRPLIVAGTAPCWTHPSLLCTPSNLGNTPPDPAYDAAWSDFFRELAARYPKAVGIEVWNEPNIAPSFRNPSPARYTQLLKAAYRGVKAADPKMPVISGGLLASVTTGSFGIADQQFLAGMYAAGARHFMDGIGIHAYPRTDPSEGPTLYRHRETEQILARVRAARNAAGDTGKKIWVTELGESTQSQSGFPPARTEARQAADLVWLVRRIGADRDVRALIIHRLVDRDLIFGGPYARVESGFGVFTTDGTPKPAACALSSVLGGSLRCG
jgi:hypothetical protein